MRRCLLGRARERLYGHIATAADALAYSRWVLSNPYEASQALGASTAAVRLTALISQSDVVNLQSQLDYNGFAIAAAIEENPYAVSQLQMLRELYMAVYGVQPAVALAAAEREAF